MTVTIFCVVVLALVEVLGRWLDPKERKHRAVLRKQMLDRIYSGRNYWEIQR